MNEDICKQLIVDDVGRDLFNPVRECGKPKNPEHLYCPDCEAEVFDEALHKQ